MAPQDGSTAPTLSIASTDASQVSISGAVVTIDPSITLQAATRYQLTVADGAFISSDGP